MKNTETAFEYIVDTEMIFYKALPMHQRINYKSNWFHDPINGNLKIMLGSPDAEKFQLI